MLYTRAVALLALVKASASLRLIPSAQLSRADVAHLRSALFLASKANGLTRPNPPVGCVIVNKEGTVVGQGFHPKAGQPHAEVFALADARKYTGKEELEGHTAYVTLEPCSHYGRTPPCSEALIEARVERVVVGMVDPDARVCGRGLSMLKEAGIAVDVMPEPEDAEDEETARVSDAIRVMLDPFCTRALQKRTYNSILIAYTDKARDHSRAFVSPKRGCLDGADAVIVTDEQMRRKSITNFLDEFPSSVRQIVVEPPRITIIDEEDDTEEEMLLDPGGRSDTFWGSLAAELADRGLCKAVFMMPWKETRDLLRSGEAQQVELRYPRGSSKDALQQIRVTCERAASGVSNPQWESCGGAWLDRVAPSNPSDGFLCMELLDVSG